MYLLRPSKIRQLFVAKLVFGFCALSPLAWATNYSVSLSGNDSNAGDAAHPFKTIQHAVNVATIAGDTVNIAAGIYREQVTAPTNSATAANPIIVQSADPANPAELRGSTPFTGWTLYAGTDIPGNSNNVYTVPCSVRPQQVFVDFNDTPSLVMVGLPTASSVWLGGSPPYYPTPVPNASGTYSRTDLASGRFWYDATNLILYVWLADGSNPSAHTMELSQAAWLFKMQGNYVHLQNLKFRHSNGETTATAGSGNQSSAIYLSQGAQVIGCDVQWMDFGGVTMGFLVPDSQVINSTISNCGAVGITGPGSYNILISGCTIEHNDNRLFNGYWHAGGIKITTNAYGTIEYNTIDNNYANGIWMDTCNSASPTTIAYNYLHDNGFGPTHNSSVESPINIEATSNTSVYNNLLVHNNRRSIFLVRSSNNKVYNNTIFNPMGELTSNQFAAIDMDVSTTGDNVKNNLVYNNLIYYDAASGANPIADTYFVLGKEPDDGTHISGNVFDNNIYYRAAGTSQWRWTHSTSSFDGIYSTFASWLAVVNTAKFGFWDAHSKNQDPAFESTSGDQYPLSATSPGVDAGRDLPADVPNDYDGVIRPQGAHFDIGAFERVQGISAGLVGYWQMNEGTGTSTADSSGHGHVGTITGATWTTGIASSSALSFDGLTNVVLCGAAADLNLTSALSVTGWFNHASSGGGSYSGVDKTGAYRLVAIDAAMTTSRWQFMITDSSGLAHSAQTTNYYSNDAWHAIAGTFDGTQIKIYVDGSLAATTNWTGSVTSSASQLEIGRRESTAYYRGAIDSVKIFNRALSSSEVLSEYSSPN